MKKQACKLIAFTIIFFVVLYGVSSILTFKYPDGILSAEAFYNQPKGAVDVLLLGSSHVYTGIDPATLYREHGAASFAFTGSAQTVWNSYYTLCEVIKTQSLKLIVLDGFYCAQMTEVDEYPVRNTLGLRGLENWLPNVLASTNATTRREVMVPSLLYHGRYQDLGREDFWPWWGYRILSENWKGYYPFAGTEEITPPASQWVTEADALPMGAKEELYYRKILALAKEREIPVLVMLTPYSVTEEQAKRLITVKRIANEYGCEYVDFNLLNDEIGLDYSMDFRDKGHLNPGGCQKFSRYFSSYLSRAYTLPDHRGDPKYVSWEKNAIFTAQQVAGFELAQIATLDEYLGALEALVENWPCVVVVSADGEYLNEQLNPIELLQAYGIPMQEGNGAVVFSQDDTLYQADKKDGLFFCELGSSDLVVKQSSQPGTITSILVNREEKTKVHNGINILVYNRDMDAVIDSAGFEASNWQAVR